MLLNRFTRSTLDRWNQPSLRKGLNLQIPDYVKAEMKRSKI